MKVTYEVDGVWYHGGTSSAVDAITGNQISTRLGGGELGVGFYVGNFGHVASAWARHKNRNDAVVAELRIASFGTSGLKKLELSWLSAKEHYINIGHHKKQRTFVFERDVVAAPIVGRAMTGSPLQLKWEGSGSEDYLNSAIVAKAVTKL